MLPTDRKVVDLEKRVAEIELSCLSTKECIPRQFFPVLSEWYNDYDILAPYRNNLLTLWDVSDKTIETKCTVSTRKKPRYFNLKVHKPVIHINQFNNAGRNKMLIAFYDLYTNQQLGENYVPPNESKVEAYLRHRQIIDGFGNVKRPIARISDDLANTLQKIKDSDRLLPMKFTIEKKFQRDIKRMVLDGVPDEDLVTTILDQYSRYSISTSLIQKTIEKVRGNHFFI